jgi:hypothetical protein
MHFNFKFVKQDRSALIIRKNNLWLSVAKNKFTSLGLVGARNTAHGQDWQAPTRLGRRQLGTSPS